MTTFHKDVRPIKALAVAALLLGTTAIFEPSTARAQDFSGLIGMAMRHYGGFSYNSPSRRHQSRHESRHESRHASRHRGGRSQEAQQNETPASSEEPTTTKSASSKAGAAPNFTPAR